MAGRSRARQIAIPPRSSPDRALSKPDDLSSCAGSSSSPGSGRGGGLRCRSRWHCRSVHRSGDGAAVHIGRSACRAVTGHEKHAKYQGKRSSATDDPGGVIDLVHAAISHRRVVVVWVCHFISMGQQWRQHDGENVVPYQNAVDCRSANTLMASPIRLIVLLSGNMYNFEQTQGMEY